MVHIWNSVLRVLTVPHICPLLADVGFLSQTSLQQSWRSSTPPVNGPLRLDLYRPEGNRICPAVIIVHGGGWVAGDRIPAANMYESMLFLAWGVGFFAPGNDHGDGGLGNPWIYLDAQTGAPVGADIPGTGSAGDVFLQSMFPLHSGRILGTTGRVVVSALGLVVAMLCITGVLIWARKRRARMTRPRD